MRVNTRNLFHRIFSFHFDFSPKAREIAEDRRDGACAAVLFVTDQAIPRFDVAIDLDRVPRFRMADIIDRDIVVLAPEKRHGIELLAAAQHVDRRCLPLPFRDGPVLNTDIRS